MNFMLLLLPLLRAAITQCQMAQSKVKFFIHNFLSFFDEMQNYFSN